MKNKGWWILVITVVGFSVFLFSEGGRSPRVSAVSVDSSDAYAPRDTTLHDTTPPAAAASPSPDTAVSIDPSRQQIHTGATPPAQVVAFAQTLVGTPYRYASADPALGFDCSGFITYVFHHFHIEVPRSSIDFTNVGREVDSLAAFPATSFFSPAPTAPKNSSGTWASSLPTKAACSSSIPPPAKPRASPSRK